MSTQNDQDHTNQDPASLAQTWEMYYLGSKCIRTPLGAMDPASTWTALFGAFDGGMALHAVSRP